MITLKTIGRNAVLFAIGGTIYYMIELILYIPQCFY